MKKRILIIILLSSLFSVEPISLIVKKRGNVKVKSSEKSLIFLNVKMNKALFSGNIIKTNKNSFAKIKYLDGRATILTFSKTEFSIEEIFGKKINLINGILKVDIKNDDNSEFKLLTPFSELSCSSCSFWIISELEKGDSFYNINGDAIVKNLIDLEQLRIIQDSTLFSSNTMGLESAITKIEEKKYLESMLINFDEFSKEENLYLDTLLSKNILEIRLINAQNIQKKIYLNYTE
tara:strand:+ start:56 stop:760 length:705 start_codon:yes stop_codon:yes gene_type:complete